jgi:hypothetical protein
MDHFDNVGMSDEAYEMTMQTLRNYPDDLLLQLDEARLNVAPGFGLIQNSVSRGESVDEVSEQMYFYREMEGATYYYARHLVASLHQYSQLPSSQDFSKENEDVRSQCSALIEVARVCENLGDEEVFDENLGVFVLADERLVDLVVRNSDKAALIADFIRQHRSVDVKFLTELLNSKSQALSNGLL